MMFHYHLIFSAMMTFSEEKKLIFQNYCCFIQKDGLTNIARLHVASKKLKNDMTAFYLSLGQTFFITCFSSFS
jgi:hypothetical protein